MLYLLLSTKYCEHNSFSFDVNLCSHAYLYFLPVTYISTAFVVQGISCDVSSQTTWKSTKFSLKAVSFDVVTPKLREGRLITPYHHLGGHTNFTIIRNFFLLPTPPPPPPRNFFGWGVITDYSYL